MKATLRDPQACLHELFESRMREHPDAPALELGGTSLTYAELDRRAERVADGLTELGVGPDTLVGLFLPRSFDLIVGLIGILKAGGGYLPIDPHAPRERIAHILDDSGAPVVLTDATQRAHLPRSAAAVLEVEALASAPASERVARRAATPADVAYVIYTSGSTGKPKGVVVEHRNVVRLFGETEDWFGFGPTDVWTLFHSIAFDFSVWELWGALLYGGRVVIVPYDVSRSPEAFHELCAEHGVTVLNQMLLAFRGFIRAEQAASKPLALRTVIFGGEALELQSLRPWFERHGEASPRLVNMYGITETTVHVTYRPITLGDLDARAGSVIGRAIPDLTLHVLDADGHDVPVGVTGEIYVGGAGVARGYLKRPELTAERFVASPFVAGERLYKSGDLARRREDGDVEYLGRVDHQVKIRGFRVELGEIESELVRHPAVAEAAVVVSGPPDDPRLVAYVVVRGDAPGAVELRRHLSVVVPEYMIPAHFVVLPNLPMTLNGKLDTRALPAPSRARPEQCHPFAAPRSETETTIARIFSELLQIEPIGVDDGFFELGGTSLLAVRAVSMLKSAFGRDVPVARFFQGPTASELARWLAGKDATSQSSPRQTPSEPARGERVAIIGFAGRFPGADSVEQLWANLCAGVESIQFFRDEELDPAVPAAVRGDRAYVRARGTIAGFDQFDPAFFGILPRDAELMDPQQRLFLEVAWEALERAGYVPDALVSIGVFAGIYGNGYLTEHVLPRADLVEKVGRLHTLILNEKDFVATHAAHRLDLRGPAVSVHTACSTSLVALCQAATSLLAGECDMALAGAASMTCPPRSGYVYQEGGMLSPDGHTRSFDARAAGTVFSDGAAVVVLKRLSDAVRDNDTIWAVIRGASVNNDGAHKASFTAPSVEGQAAVIARAHAAAGIGAEQVSYVEAHGTATPIGDPIEVEALTQAFRRSTSRTGFCALGSIKSNIGHLVAASGAAGVIKVALALHHRVIPPSLHFESPNPNIAFDSSPFFVNDRLRPWVGPEPLTAGVSSFGVGGTNAHVVVERGPDSISEPSSLPVHVLGVSARSDAALDRALSRLADHLESDPEASLADVAFTLGVGRKAFASRAVVVAADRAQAVRALRTPTAVRRHHVEARPEVAFAFPGQGSQYVAMGKALYGVDAVFRAVLDRCSEILTPHLGGDLVAILHDSGADEASLRQTALTQPALFAIEYALAEVWLGLGLRPAALIGHSVGEFVAAALAGVFSLEDALALVATRARLMQAIAPGTMLGVRMRAGDIEPRLPAGVSVAADNAPSLCVVSGPDTPVEQLRLELEAEGIACRRLHTSHAFHSPMMEPVLPALRDAIRAVRLAPNGIPIASTATGTWLRPEEATDPDYWATHLLRTVRFGPAVATLLEPSSNIGLFIEVGPRATLATLTRQAQRGVRVATSLGESPETEIETFVAGVGEAWLSGAPVDFTSLHAGSRRRRVVLPTYPFERRRVWIDARPATASERFSESVSEAPNVEVPIMTTPAPTSPGTSRPSRRVHELAKLVEDVSGFDLDGADPNTSFLELGLDSLTLTQVALQLGRTFGVKMSFRKLMEDVSSVARLAEFLDAELPAEVAAPAPVQSVAAMPLPGAEPTATSPYVREVIDQQLRLMAQQLALLSGSAGATLPVSAPVQSPAAKTPTDEASGAQVHDAKKAFGAIARISTAPAEELGSRERARLDAFVRRYTARTRKSKEHTQAHRAKLADPRAVTGFRQLFKELVYPIVIERSSGSRLWDIDGNEYIDVLSGFGSNLFGWQPDFLTEALKDQLTRGHEIGPMPPLAAEVAELVCEFTGFDRAGFCNTGSEAVMGCMRIARTVTGRSTIALFSGSYHGIFDEVIVRGTKKLKAVPAAPGIMPSSAANVLVLDYGTEQSLEILRARASELAAIMVEPVQSRRPDFQPREFLHELRTLADASGAVYIFDEVITGFRSHPGGAQALFGVKADLASYGKVIGGGLPFGVIAGKQEYMDALDGGFWRFGDDSVPTAGVTYFAGTFCRHPLALAAAKASLLRLKEAGPSLQETLTAKTTALAAELNAHFRAVGASLEIRHFASLWKTFFTVEQPYGELLFTALRDNGIHVLEGFPCFMTTAHTDADLARVVQAFKDSVAELQRSGFLSGGASADETSEHLRRPEPPAPGARLGRDPNGDPAWFVPNPDEPGGYVKVELGS